MKREGSSGVTTSKVVTRCSKPRFGLNLDSDLYWEENLLDATVFAYEDWLPNARNRLQYIAGLQILTISIVTVSFVFAIAVFGSKSYQFTRATAVAGSIALLSSLATSVICTNWVRGYGNGFGDGRSETSNVVAGGSFFLLLIWSSTVMLFGAQVCWYLGLDEISPPRASLI